MPRPCKRRRVCALPGCRRFGDLEGDRHQEPIEMAVDEFEAIRLVDLLDLTQEEAARQMGVARATVQSIYGSARKKLALSLVEGRELRIGGGEYQVCPGDQGCPHCPKISAKGAKSAMKIAVTYENGQVFQHFGHTAQFKIYEVQDGQVASSQVVDTNGSGHGALAGFLNAQGVDTLICGGWPRSWCSSRISCAAITRATGKAIPVGTMAAEATVAAPTAATEPIRESDRGLLFAVPCFFAAKPLGCNLFQMRV